MTAAKPNLWQYIGYSYGRRLPDSMRSWVARDLAGEGAVRRHMIRWAIPPLFVLAPLWLLPASLYVHTEMTAPLYIWALLISLALTKSGAGTGWLTTGWTQIWSMRSTAGNRHGCMRTTSAATGRDPNRPNGSPTAAPSRGYFRQLPASMGSVTPVT